MKARDLRTLTLATVAAALLAAITLFTQVEGPELVLEDTRFFPDLVHQMETLKSVVVQEGTATASLDWNGARWVLREANNYPANQNSIAELVIGLARLEKLEPKTSKSELYRHLDLQDPEVPNSRSTQIVLIDSEGHEIANIIAGKLKYTLGGDERGTHVRVPSQPQSWLARGEIDVGADPADWLEQPLIDIPSSAIRQITVRRPSGEHLTIERNSSGTVDFDIRNVPAGRELASPSTPLQFAELLESLDIQDVSEAGNISFENDNTISVDVEGLDGFVMQIRMIELDGSHWIQFEGVTVSDEANEKFPSLGALKEKSQGRVFRVPQTQVSIYQKGLLELLEK